MKKLFIVTLLLMFCSEGFCANYQSTKYYTLTERNSRGQKVSTTRYYYQGEKQNIKKIERYSTSGKRTNLYK